MDIETRIEHVPLGGIGKRIEIGITGSGGGVVKIEIKRERVGLRGHGIVVRIRIRSVRIKRRRKGRRGRRGRPLPPLQLQLLVNR